MICTCRRPMSLAAIRDCLTSFPDMDKMLTGLTTTPKTLTVRTARRGIDTLIFIKHSIRAAYSLADEIKKFLPSVTDDQGTLDLLGTMCSLLTDDTLNLVRALIDEILTESTTYTKSSMEMRHQECFAVRSGRHGELDVARKTYLSNVEDIYKVSFSISILIPPDL